MSQWVVSLPSDKSEERWMPIATCKTMEALVAIVSGLMLPDCDGPLVVRVEKQRYVESGK